MSRAAQSKAIRDSLRVATARRVYVLPGTLVDRIIEYQSEQRLPSEVAAVRALLDEGLAIVEKRL